MSGAFLRIFHFIFLILISVIEVHAEVSTLPEVTLKANGKDTKIFRSLEPSSLVIHYGFQREEVAFSLKVENTLTKPKLFYIIFLWSHLDQVEVCLEFASCTKAGYGFPVASWPIAQIFPTFPMEVRPNETQEIRVKIRSKNFVESEIMLVTTEELFELISWQTGLVFSFLIFILLLLFRLAYLTYRRPEIWMFYLLGFHFSILLVFVFGSGIANCYIFPDQAIPLSLFKKTIVGILIILGSGWLSNYLDTRSLFPGTHRFYQLASICSVILVVLSYTDTPRLLISISFTILYLGITGISLALAISRLQDQLKPTPWLILSLLCLLFFEILNIFSYESLDSHDSKIYLFFLSTFLPASSFFVSRTIRGKIADLESELTLTKLEIIKFKKDLDKSLNAPTISDKKTYLSGVNIEKVLEKLKTLMTEEKMFREEELRLADLSALLGLTVHQTSEILNQILKISFVDLLKQYRVEEAKRMLIEEKDKSILDIALECGFLSKSVFNDAFKKNVSLTPAEFRKSNQTKN